MSRWFWYASFATIWIVPVFLGIPFFAKNFHVKPEVFMTWYFAGASLGVAVWKYGLGQSLDLRPHAKVLLAIVGFGVTFGAAANSSLFRAVAIAPNPGLPPVVYSAASVLVFLAAAVLSNRLPKYFNRVNTDVDRFAGILLVLLGLFLVAGGWPLLKGTLAGSTGAKASAGPR